jgi:hypothetical protein
VGRALIYKEHIEKYPYLLWFDVELDVVVRRLEVRLGARDGFLSRDILSRAFSS